jgi:hypothetical protein
MKYKGAHENGVPTRGYLGAQPRQQRDKVAVVGVLGAATMLYSTSSRYLIIAITKGSAHLHRRWDHVPAVVHVGAVGGVVAVPVAANPRVHVSDVDEVDVACQATGGARPF